MVVDVKPNDVPRLKDALKEMEITECDTLPPLKNPFGPSSSRVFTPQDTNSRYSFKRTNSYPKKDSFSKFKKSEGRGDDSFDQKFNKLFESEN